MSKVVLCKMLLAVNFIWLQRTCSFVTYDFWGQMPDTGMGKDDDEI